jgi:CelD/BcsL family acetyltransferase involved in cellulose biosynthesis
MKVSVHRCERGKLPDLREAWATCLRATPEHQRLFTFEWYAAWMATIGCRAPWTGESVVLVAQTEDGQPAGILPLAYQRQAKRRVLSFAGYVQPVRGFVCRTEQREQVCAALAERLLQLDYDMLRVGPFVADGNETELLLQQIKSATGNVVEIPRGRNIVATPLPASFDAYQKEVLGTHLLANIRQRDRRLRREGELVVRHFAHPVGAEIEQVLKDCGIVEANSWVGKTGGYTRFSKDVDAQFWRKAIAETLSPNRQFDAWLMYFNGQPVSFVVTLTAGRTRYFIANQYDERFRKYGPGAYLYHCAFEQGYQVGVNCVDFAEGDLHYKGQWGGREDGMRLDVFVFPTGAFGFVVSRALRFYLAAQQKLESSRWGRRIAARLPKI